MEERSKKNWDWKENQKALEGPFDTWALEGNLGTLAFYPVDTRRKLNVRKTFRRRPGRLLNVLCTFNLCPVSTG